MSGDTIAEFWHLGNYVYPLYIFLIENFCYRCFSKNGLIILDAGCGPNISSLSRVPEGVYCVGIDVSSKNIAKSHIKAKTKKYQNFSFIVGSVTELPFRGEIFHLILCCDVLEHIKAKQKAIDEFWRVCKSQGEFLGSTTNILNPLMLFDSLLPKRITYVLTQKFTGERHYERYSRFTVSGLLRSLIEAGFQRGKVKLLGFPPFRASIYEFYEKKLPWFAFFWIVFDKLTNINRLRLIKNMMVFSAQKK